MKTYGEAIAVLGEAYVKHLYRHPRIEDCIEEVRGLQEDCAAKGIQSRAHAYGQVLAAMEEFRDATAEGRT